MMRDSLHFHFMSLGFKVRDLFTPPRVVLSEVGIKPGFHVLDYGCGPGSFSLAAAELVGETGKVYAVDINLMAIRRVQKLVSKMKLRSIETIRTDCATGLDNESVDTVLLYDTYHDLSDPDGVVEELHRILKPQSVLSFSDHHMKEDEILSKIAEKNLFGLLRKGKRSYIFYKSLNEYSMS